MFCFKQRDETSIIIKSNLLPCLQYHQILNKDALFLFLQCFAGARGSPSKEWDTARPLKLGLQKQQNPSGGHLQKSETETKFCSLGIKEITIFEIQREQ